jgi:hypothetical protein
MSWNGSKERADINKDGAEVVLILMPAFSATALSPSSALFRAYQEPEDVGICGQGVGTTLLLLLFLLTLVIHVFFRPGTLLLGCSYE